MKTIRIVEGDGLNKISIRSSEPVAPGPAEVRIRWHATSLNFHDYLVACGGIIVPEGRIPMSDGAGEVIEVGSQVSSFKVGDKVMSMFFPDWQEGAASFNTIRAITGESIDGCMTTESCLPESAITHIPDNYSYAEAATLPTAALTAWNALICNGKLSAGQKVLIEGTGGVSIFAMQLSLAMGAEVYATSSSAHKAERLKQMGVKEVINYKEDPLWGKSIFQLSGTGVDHVIDVGGGSTMKQSIEAATIGGHIHAIGILGNGRKGEITFPKLFFKFITMQGLAVGSRQMQIDMVNALNDFDFRPVLDRSFEFDQLKEAFEYQVSGQHFGKIVAEF